MKIFLRDGFPENSRCRKLEWKTRVLENIYRDNFTPDIKF